MKWRVILPLVMLSLAALACDGYRAPVVSVSAIETDPERPGVAYIEISTAANDPSTSINTQPQYFEISDYGYTWQPSEQPIAQGIPTEYKIQMDQHQTLLIDDTATWAYALPPSADMVESEDPRQKTEGTFPTAFNQYRDGMTIYPVPGPPPWTPLDYAISPADPHVMYIAMHDLGVLVGPAPGTDSNRPWELHILRTNMDGAVIPAESGRLFDRDIVLDVDKRGALKMMLFVTLISLLPASLLHRWIIVRHWRRYDLRRFRGEFAGLLWFYALVQAVLSALLWQDGFIPYGLVEGVLAASVLIAIFTALATYVLGRVNEYPLAALKKPILIAVLYTAIPPALWAITFLGLVLWPLFGLIVFDEWLWGKNRQGRQANAEENSTPADAANGTDDTDKRAGETESQD